MSGGDSVKNDHVTVRELALLFFRLGALSFGGPAAHIALMEDETVKRRKWLTHEQFLDLLGATNLIPGPNSTEMAIHIGYVKAGWRGLAVAGMSFIFPAAVITLLFAYLYVHFGAVPQLAAFMFGIRAAIIAVILAAVYRLSRPLLKNRHLIFLGLAVTALNLFHIDEIVLLLGAGLASIVWEHHKRIWPATSALLQSHVLPVVTMFFPAGEKEANAAAVSLSSLGLFFLKVGSILYGSGYVLVAFLEGGLVENHHWLTQQQLLDAIAIGQFTPGPILSTATFIGYVLLGGPGAAVATGAIFFASFVYVMLSSQLITIVVKSALA